MLPLGNNRIFSCSWMRKDSFGEWEDPRDLLGSSWNFAGENTMLEKLCMEISTGETKQKFCLQQSSNGRKINHLAGEETRLKNHYQQWLYSENTIVLEKITTLLLRIPLASWSAEDYTELSWEVVEFGWGLCMICFCTWYAKWMWMHEYISLCILWVSSSDSPTPCLE